MQNDIPVGDAAIRTGLETVQWPGRMQLIQMPGGQQILLDGAHNVAGAKVLRNTLEKYFGSLKRTLILGVLRDKDWQHICETLAPLAARIITCPGCQRTDRRRARTGGGVPIGKSGGRSFCL